ncbi:unnamed protein product [Amoebophrya sp. A120]|nr:unnamed protein product [Amoebophrya sp. A120]|eukprot:GSA120T00001899001.1
MSAHWALPGSQTGDYAAEPNGSFYNGEQRTPMKRDVVPSKTSPGGKMNNQKYQQQRDNYYAPGQHLQAGTARSQQQPAHASNYIANTYPGVGSMSAPVSAGPPAVKMNQSQSNRDRARSPKNQDATAQRQTNRFTSALADAAPAQEPYQIHQAQPRRGVSSAAAAPHAAPQPQVEEGYRSFKNNWALPDSAHDDYSAMADFVTSSLDGAIIKQPPSGAYASSTGGATKQSQLVAAASSPANAKNSDTARGPNMNTRSSGTMRSTTASKQTYGANLPKDTAAWVLPPSAHGDYGAIADYEGMESAQNYKDAAGEAEPLLLSSVADLRQNFLRASPQNGFLNWKQNQGLVARISAAQASGRSPSSGASEVVRLSAANAEDFLFDTFARLSAAETDFQKTKRKTRHTDTKFREQLFAPPDQDGHPDKDPENANASASEEPCCHRLCWGKCHCCVNTMCCPVVMPYHACRVYCCPTLGAVCGSCWLTICCSSRCCKYTDSEFLPASVSIGANIQGDGGEKQLSVDPKQIKWIRAPELPSSFTADVLEKRDAKGKVKQEPTVKLFGNKLSPNTICQGALGNCWLLSAMACLAEHRGAVRHIFETQFLDVRGKYFVTLYDACNSRDVAGNAVGAWVRICIDDFIPCTMQRRAADGTLRAEPVFTQYRNYELWPLLLEKAFAKFCGSYANLEGGSALWALQAMTGDKPYMFELNAPGTGEWKGFEMVNFYQQSPDENKKRMKQTSPSKTNYGFVALPRDAVGHSLSTQDMWNVLLNFHNRGSIITAGGVRAEAFGLRANHAYSVLDFYESGNKIRLVLIRNPWGSGEWTGDWSQSSPKWDKYPKAKEKCFMKQGEGKFWMSWTDFCAHWSRLQVLERSVSMDNLYLEVQEGNCCGPCIGCARGCAGFFCCCRGVERLYYPRTANEGIQVHRDCTCCCLRCAKPCWAKFGCWVFWFLIVPALVLVIVLAATGHLTGKK